MASEKNILFFIIFLFLEGISPVTLLIKIGQGESIGEFRDQSLTFLQCFGNSPSSIPPNRLLTPLCMASLSPKGKKKTKCICDDSLHTFHYCHFFCVSHLLPAVRGSQLSLYSSDGNRMVGNQDLPALDQLVK